MGARRCAACGHTASDRARFCEGCGAAPDAERGSQCGRRSALETRILEERAGIEGERKQVTVMYADVVGSMELTRAGEPSAGASCSIASWRWPRPPSMQFEGTVNQFTGDGLLAVFGAPLAHEDHARRACLAVLELQREVAGLAAEVARATAPSSPSAAA